MQKTTGSFIATTSSIATDTRRLLDKSVEDRISKGLQRFRDSKEFKRITVPEASTAALLKREQRLVSIELRRALKDFDAKDKESDIEKLKTYLLRGADVNYDFNDNSTILSCAISTNNTEIVKTIIKHGADAYQRAKIPPCPSFMPPLALAIGEGSCESVIALIECNVAVDPTSLSFFCAQTKNLELLKYLLSIGLNPNSFYEHTSFMSVLSSAAQCADIETLEHLIQSGADLNRIHPSENVRFVEHIVDQELKRVPLTPRIRLEKKLTESFEKTIDNLKN